MYCELFGSRQGITQPVGLAGLVSTHPSYFEALIRATLSKHPKGVRQERPQETLQRFTPIGLGGMGAFAILNTA